MGNSCHKAKNQNISDQLESKSRDKRNSIVKGGPESQMDHNRLSNSVQTNKDNQELQTNGSLAGDKTIAEQLAAA